MADPKSADPFDTPGTPSAEGDHIRGLLSTVTTFDQILLEMANVFDLHEEPAGKRKAP